MSNSKNGPVPTSLEDFCRNYPHLADDLSKTKNVEEWNDVREIAQHNYSPSVIVFIDTSGMIKKKQVLKHYLDKIMQEEGE